MNEANQASSLAQVLWTDHLCHNFELLVCLAILISQKTVIMESKFGCNEILKVSVRGIFFVLIVLLPLPLAYQRSIVKSPAGTFVKTCRRSFYSFETARSSNTGSSGINLEYHVSEEAQNRW